MVLKSIIIAGLLLALSGCNKPNGPVAGDGAHAGNALVSGKLYKATGPAAGAKVYFVKVNYNPHTGALGKALAITDTATTDSTGKYGTNDLDTGTYNVFGVGTDGNLSLEDSIPITGDTQALQPDTLKIPASLSGFIKLQPGAEPDKIIAIAMGSNTFSLIDTVAHFNFANLAEGRYAVKFFSTLDDYSNYDTTFTIVAGTNVSLPDSIVIPLKIPIPTGFTIKYDTLRQIVTLSWNRMNPAKVKGYNMYRQHVDSAEVKVNAQPLLDTFYVDSTGIQDQTYIYSVASVDLGNKEGFRTAGDSVKIIPLYSFVKGWGTLNCSNGTFCDPRGMELDGNGNLYIIDVGFDSVLKFDTLGNFLMGFGGFGVDSGKFNDPSDVISDKENNIYIADKENARIQKFSATGQLQQIILLDSAQIGFVCKPWHILIDSTNILYTIAPKGSSSIDQKNFQAFAKYDSNGAFISSENIAPKIQNEIARDLKFKNSMFYISTAYKLFIFDLGLNLIRTIDSTYYPIALGKDSLIYIGDRGLNNSATVKVLNSSGEIIAKFGQAPTTENRTTSIGFLYGMILDRNFNLFTLENGTSSFAVKRFKLSRLL